MVGARKVAQNNQNPFMGGVIWKNEPAFISRTSPQQP